MKTLQVQITDQDYSKYHFDQKGELTFVELEELISMEYAKKALILCTEIAEKNGLSNITLDEINSEIKAVREAKSNTGH